jgi:hypothetical protein
MVQFAHKNRLELWKRKRKYGKSTRDCFPQVSGAFQEFAFFACYKVFLVISESPFGNGFKKNQVFSRPRFGRGQNEVLIKPGFISRTAFMSQKYIRFFCEQLWLHMTLRNAREGGCMSWHVSRHVRHVGASAGGRDLCCYHGCEHAHSLPLQAPWGISNRKVWGIRND